MKAILMGILLIAILITISANGTAFAFPAHCDRAGYPSCYDVGFGGGQASPGTRCPSGHSAAFCSGWNAGSNSISNTGVQSTQQNAPSSSNKTSDQSSTFVFIVLFLLISAIIALKLRNRGKSKERKGFSQYVKENILRTQDHKCAHCRKLLNVVDWDHKDGNRSALLHDSKNS